ncbi:hypothetical protein BDV37DRAFT_279517 [Aspergillus pseudonomiae]|uniref:Berberine/berberine-like domain-containing protein n=1 Tax=Aspergillus pseudonomiae TaxID=1506151 RepID=A0A5N7DQF6_9EURO|nr:uncharacterized protein BDV37DRAFT_279517 [Aspergillus pseudonomiae]KAE8407728.1 hypothetical protein BDV37DRAFT_279517 [Aspergillus pseudonomiae]
MKLNIFTNHWLHPKPALTCFLARSPPAPNQMEHFANDVLGIWRKPCPEAGVYTSKVNIVEPNFHQSFYGSNYERLYQLKQSYDASGLFYALTGVGSENWTVKNRDGLPDQNGLSRLVWSVHLSPSM